MRKTSIKTRFLVPLMVLILAFAFAPAAFAEDAVTAGEFDEGEEVDPGSDIDVFGPGEALESAEITFDSGQSFVYTGKDVTPKFTVWLPNKETGNKEALVEGKDYEVFYMDNITAGPAYAYAWCQDSEHMYIKEQQFNITKAPMTATTIKIADKIYTGKKQTPPPSISYRGMALKQGTDFTVAYKNNKKVGTATVTITGKGNYAGTVKKTFKIRRASIADAKMTNLKPKMYTGKKITPKVTVKYKGKKLKVNKDYKIKYKNNKNVGIASVVVKGMGNLKGKRVLEFAITAAPMKKCKISYQKSWEWNGSIIKPSPTVKYKGKTLKNGKDYLVNWGNNAGVGTGKIYITGKGNFTGTYKGTFEITLLPLSSSLITTTPDTGAKYYYSANAVLPSVNVRIYANGRRYIVSSNYYDVFYDGYSLADINASPTIYDRFRGQLDKSTSHTITIQAKPGREFFTGSRQIKYTVLSQKNSAAG